MNCATHQKVKAPCCPVCLIVERDRYRHALRRIARAETEVRGLRPGLYGHAVRIAEEALSNNRISR
jgi:hypothetical protein